MLKQTSSQAVPVTGHIVAAAKAGLPGPLLIPCMPHHVRPDGNSPGKTPARLTAHGEWVELRGWTSGCALTGPEKLRTDEAGANCGLVLGAPHEKWQYLFVDIDTEPGIEPDAPSWKIAEQISARALARFQKALGLSALWVRRTRPTRAGVLVRLPALADPGRKAKLQMYSRPDRTGRGKIELLSRGQQAVIGGLHAYKQGTPIRWYRTDRPDALERAPVIDEAIPTFESREALNAAIDAVVKELTAFGVEFSAKSLSAGTTNDRPLTEADMAPPTVDMLVELLDALPHDARIDRDEWVQTLRSVAGCCAALQHGNRLTDDDRTRIEDAVVRWDTRWSEQPWTEEQSREKWESDFAGSPNTDIPCWRLLVDKAIFLGNASLHAESLRLRADEIAEDFTEGLEDAPPDYGVAVHASEDALALEFARRHVGQLVHVAALSGWYRWTGSKWAEGAKPAAFTLAREVCRSQAKALQTDDDGLARKVSSAATVAAVLTLAASDQRHARLPEEFDADDWSLNTPAGVVDLQTGAVRPHRIGELMMKCTSVSPGGLCPIWLRFLSEITRGDGDVMAYIQRWAGYMLTGSTREHAFLFLYGPGGNGKSVMIDALAAMLGDYTTPAMPSVFAATRNDAHSTETAALRGARLVTVGETEEGTAWAEAKLKSLTGGDRIAARVSRGDPFIISPKFKLVIAGNHRPGLRNVDAAMRRRLHLLPLTFVPAVPDQCLPDALRRELGGILAWAIAGAIQWQRSGLDAPSVVREATDSYFSEADTLGAWIDDRCIRDPASSESSSTLFVAFSSFVVGRKEAPRTAMWFAVAMEKHFVKRRTKAGVVFDGIALQSFDGGF